MSKEELVKAGAPIVVPDFLKEVRGHEGLENVQQEDLVLPRLAICQSMSPQRVKGSAEHIAGLEEGDYFNTVTREVYSEVTLIPVLYQRSRIYFRKLTEGGGILCQSRNGINGGKLHPAGCESCEHSRFTDDGKPHCDLFMNMVSLLIEPTVPSPQLVVVSFKSAALKTAKQWVALLQARDFPPYAQVYNFKTISQKNTKGTYYIPKIDLKRYVSPEEFAFAKGQYEDLRGKDIDVEPEVDGEVVHDDAAQAAF
jgi:hypothetical protein